MVRAKKKSSLELTHQERALLLAWGLPLVLSPSQVPRFVAIMIYFPIAWTPHVVIANLLLSLNLVAYVCETVCDDIGRVWVLNTCLVFCRHTQRKKYVV